MTAAVPRDGQQRKERTDMRKITLWLTATVAVLVLLLSYRTSTSGPRLGTVAVAPGAPAGVVAGGGTTTSRTMTVNGTAAQTQWGPVQVQIKIVAGRIADVVVLRHPTGSGDGPGGQLIRAAATAGAGPRRTERAHQRRQRSHGDNRRLQAISSGGDQRSTLPGNADRRRPTRTPRAAEPRRRP